METKTNRIFLIGNGFDLSHDLETSYKSFIIWYLKKSVKNALESGINKYTDDCLAVIVGPNKFANPLRHNEVYNELEDQISRGKLNIIDKPRTSGNSIINRNPSKVHNILSFSPQNRFIKTILQECMECDWNGIEDEIYKTIMTSHFKIQKFQRENATSPVAKKAAVYPHTLAEIQKLNKSVNCLKSSLQEYLTTQNVPKEHKIYLFEKVASTLSYEVPAEVDLEDPKNLSTNLFLNFNYTTYVKDIVREIEGIHGNHGTVFQTLNIHGDLDSDVEDVVFGLGDEQNDFYQEIESNYDDAWLQCMKSFHYFRNQNYQDLLGFIKRGNYEIYVMGHSCSITDRTLLNMLFEDKHCEKIHVFHYNGMASYLRTTYNIARNFTDKVKMREVLMPFNPKLTMQ
ncbi:hypothetical protein HP439_14740 [Sphingobacterium shayense]|uniref:AbiH family protein n=1 Tax=Sphingobacterium shayense TaxID=626343 RepID=UPI0015530DD8|nr:AbiH family protein [Sphingobacterium shayense]NQD71981.1 hypothetical protein [Sphingobacterium shayense]